MLALGAHAVPVPADVDKDGTPRALGEERHVLARLVHEVATLKATACVSSSSTPPKLHGVFENTGGVNLVSGTNQAVYPKPPAPPCIGSAFKFSQTVPSDPRLVVLTRLNPCEPGETHKGAACVDGFYETKPMAGAWVWGGCQWTLWGTDNDDIGIQIVTPMEVDAEGVASITYHYLETGPPYMIPSKEAGASIVNPYQEGLVAIATFSRVEKEGSRVDDDNSMHGKTQDRPVFPIDS